MADRISKTLPSVKASSTTRLSQRPPLSPEAEHKHHHKLFKMAFLFSLLLLVPAVIWFLIELFFYIRSPSIPTFNAVHEPSALKLSAKQIEGGQTLSIDYSKSQGVTQCLLVPSYDSKKVLANFSDYKNSYKTFLEFEYTGNQKDIATFIIPDSSRFWNLICRKLSTAKNSVTIYDPELVLSGILSFSPPISEIHNLETNYSGKCLIVTGQKPLNQDLICGLKESKSEEIDLLAATSDEVMTALGTVSNENYLTPFQKVKCFEQEIKPGNELECTMRTTLNENDLEGKHLDRKQTYLTTENNKKVTITQENEIENSFLSCLEGKGVETKIKEILVDVDDLIVGQEFKCENLTENGVTYLVKVLKFLEENKPWKTLNSFKLEKVIEKLEKVIGGTVEGKAEEDFSAEEVSKW